eukprot:6175487-Pleurochrysis_carterae.AAC.1
MQRVKFWNKTPWRALFTTRTATVREQAQAQRLSAPTGRLWEEGAQRAAAAMRERGFQSLRNGARALRKYACDASPIWVTVHVGVRLQMKGARDDTL